MFAAACTATHCIALRPCMVLRSVSCDNRGVAVASQAYPHSASNCAVCFCVLSTCVVDICLWRTSSIGVGWQLLAVLYVCRSQQVVSGPADLPQSGSIDADKASAYQCMNKKFRVVCCWCRSQPLARGPAALPPGRIIDTDTASAHQCMFSLCCTSAADRNRWRVGLQPFPRAE
jgi:hypothetical protein